jgi:hypothetical protein
MHKDTALKNIPISDRCPGWQTGRCTLPGAHEHHFHNCADCGMVMQASTGVYLKKVIDAHKKKVMWIMSSQCEQVQAGTYGV